MILASDRKLPTEVWPTTKTGAALLLIHASEYLDHDRTCYIQEHPPIDRDYHDHKAGQLCEFTADLLLAQARIEAWRVDLGFNGKCIEDSSIGGIPCISSDED